MKKTLEQRKEEATKILKFYINELTTQEEMTLAQIGVINSYCKEVLTLTKKIEQKREKEECTQ